jgi:hypothetical protein
MTGNDMRQPTRPRWLTDDGKKKKKGKDEKITKAKKTLWR